MILVSDRSEGSQTIPTNTDQWYVPGYENFTVDEAGSHVWVTMAVIDEPQVWVPDHPHRVEDIFVLLHGLMEGLDAAPPGLQDGVELDVYGDGYYRYDGQNTDQWYVPGTRAAAARSLTSNQSRPVPRARAMSARFLLFRRRR